MLWVKLLELTVLALLFTIHIVVTSPAKHYVAHVGKSTSVITRCTVIVTCIICLIQVLT